VCMAHQYPRSDRSKSLQLFYLLGVLIDQEAKTWTNWRARTELHRSPSIVRVRVNSLGGGNLNNREGSDKASGLLGTATAAFRNYLGPSISVSLFLSFGCASCARDHNDGVRNDSRFVCFFFFPRSEIWIWLLEVRSAGVQRFQ
jgi:hypothetical protein